MSSTAVAVPAPSSARFYFAVLADTQLGLWHNNNSWEEEFELGVRAVASLNALRPRPAFAIVCGDLVNKYPVGDDDIRARQVADFKAIFSQLSSEIPLVCVCGNHDVGNRPTPQTIAQFTSEFNVPTFFSFDCGPSFVGIVLNSSLLHSPTGAPEVLAQQQRWLEAEIRSVSCQSLVDTSADFSNRGMSGDDPASRTSLSRKHVVLFLHHPLFLLDENEDDDDTRLGTTTWTGEFGAKCSIENSYFHLPLAVRAPLLALCRQAGIRYIFSGHWHRCLVARTADGIEQVITSAVGYQMGSDLSGLRLVKVHETELLHHYFDFDSIPTSVDANSRDWVL